MAIYYSIADHRSPERGRLGTFSGFVTELYGFCLSIAYTACRHHPYIWCPFHVLCDDLHIVVDTPRNVACSNVPGLSSSSFVNEWDHIQAWIKMCESNPGLHVSVWKEPIACVTRAMRETWQAWCTFESLKVATGPLEISYRANICRASYRSFAQYRIYL